MMKKTNEKRIDSYIRSFSREAGSIALDMQKSNIITNIPQNKNISKVVSAADLKIGQFAEDYFSKTFPGSQVIQEETVNNFDPKLINEDTLLFIIDPIDATHLYVRDSFAWTISVGCFQGFKPISGCVFAPKLNEFYYTENGQSFFNGHVIKANQLGRELQNSIMLRHLKAYHNIDTFPGYTAAYGSVGLHMALVARGFAACCVASRHKIHDIAGSIKLLQNAKAELLYTDSSTPSWKDLILNPNKKAPKHFFACPIGQSNDLLKYAVKNNDIGQHGVIS